jgi:hypothetical protein
MIGWAARWLNCKATTPAGSSSSRYLEATLVCMSIQKAKNGVHVGLRR